VEHAQNQEVPEDPENVTCSARKRQPRPGLLLLYPASLVWLATMLPPGSIAQPFVAADFVAGPTSGIAPLTVVFTNLSSGATNYSWDFGDGHTSTALNPINTYSNAGAYTVSLAVTGPDGSDNLTRTNYIVVTNPVANFTASPTNGVAPLWVFFNNLSSGAASYKWDFGDGHTSTEFNPVNIYSNDSNVGIYTVSLTAATAGGTNVLTRTNYVVVTNALANFIAGPTSGVAPLYVSFTNLTSGANGATRCYWDFGDGRTSTAFNPVNTFSNAGPYAVSLTAYSGHGSNVLTRANYIVVTNPFANFTASPTSGVAPLYVSFHNLSSGAFRYYWDFGDGRTSTDSSPLNTYSNAGAYTVSLTAIAGVASNVFTRTNYIVATNPVANFTASPTSGVAPLFVSFNNLSSGAFRYYWDFGDGHTSTDGFPFNTYSNAGTYTVGLTAIAGVASNVLTHTNYIVVTSAARLAIMPASLNFGLTPTGGVVVASLVVSNAGDVALNGSATLSPGSFAVMSGSPFNLVGSVSTNLVIRFSPTTSGLFSNAVVFASNGGDSTNAVAGRAIAPPLISAPRLSADQVTFSFDTMTGFTYLVHYKDSFDDPVWQTVQTVTGDGTVKAIGLPLSAAAQRFYRLAVE
jgi:PKD repeat protein